LSNVIDLNTTPDLGTDRLTPAEGAALLADLVGVLLPGEGVWPSGRDVGVQALLALRLIEERGKAAFPTLVAALIAAGAPFEGRDEAARVGIVERFEAAEPALFAWVRDAAYIAYYENPFVAEAINARGQIYELRPHLKGYPVGRFDLEKNTPRHGRGRYTPTAAVRRVDTSGLDLESGRTTTWGVNR
jgi:hypothetical protein